MGSRSGSDKEHTIREYPNVTYWLEANRVEGWGNLVLTTHRLIFLNRVVLEDWHAEKINQYAKDPDPNKLIDFAMKLHKKNFQIPLSSVLGARMGVYLWLPFPRFCMKIQYLTRKDCLAESGFWFRIPLLKGLLELEPVLVLGWVNSVKSALRSYQKSHPSALR